MSKMEKRFIHEKLRDPALAADKEPWWEILRAYIDSFLLFRQSSEFMEPPFDSIPVKYIRMAIAKRGLDPDIAEPIISHTYTDPAMSVLASIGPWFVYEEPRSFVFAKEFWPALRKTKLDRISWDMLPEEFTGTFRFPDPIIDHDGDRVHEVMIAIRPREVGEYIRRATYDGTEGEGSRILFMWWTYESTPSSGYTVQLIPDGPAPILPDTWTPDFVVNDTFVPEFERKLPAKEFSEHVKDMIKALFYVCSGDPDIRSERNKIICKPGTGNPIAVHREFSRLKYELVGWNWMKKLLKRTYTKDGWLVEPFARYQPYGPRENPSYRWIIVEGHERHRRKPLEKEHNNDGRQV